VFDYNRQSMFHRVHFFALSVFTGTQIQFTPVDTNFRIINLQHNASLSDKESKYYKDTSDKITGAVSQTNRIDGCNNFTLLTKYFAIN